LAAVEKLLEQLAHWQESFKKCAELQAAYVEILNVLAGLGFRKQVAELILPEDLTQQGVGSSALLDLHATLKLVYGTAERGDVDILRMHFLKTLNRDINTATRMLEMIPEAWKQVDSASARSGLCNLYQEACTVASAPEVRTQALSNLGSLMDSILSRGDVTEFPTTEQLDRLWNQLRKGNINPALSCAVVETSGTIMAVLVTRDPDTVPDIEQRLRSWGDMLADCLDVDNVSCRH
jgi:hypothetical protein